MAPHPLPSFSLLSQTLEYDPSTGLFLWKWRPIDMYPSSDLDGGVAARRNNERYAGKPAMAVRSASGHLKGCINGRYYLAHRIAWKMHYGVDPNGEIDHINGDPSDNRIANLRDVSHKINQRNRKRDRDNVTGSTGVIWHPRRRRWVAQMTVNGRRQWLGQFTDKADAIAARRAAERHHGFHENHGRDALAV